MGPYFFFPAREGEYFPLFPSNYTERFFPKEIGPSPTDKVGSAPMQLRHIKGRRLSNNEDIQPLRDVLELGKH